MKTIHFLILFCAISFTTIQAQISPSTCAIKTIEASMKAVGGAEMLDSLHTVKISALGHRLMYEQSERPEGPYIADYFDLEIRKDLENNRLEYSKHSKSFDYDITYLINDSLVARDMNHSGRWFPVAKSIELDLSLAPERLLQTALQAKNVHCEKDTVLQKIPHKVLGFKHEGRPVRIFINKNTDLVTAVERVGPLAVNNYHIWGDIPTTVYYSMYSLEKNNLLYPYQWDIYIDGKPSEKVMILSLEQNPVLENDLLFPAPSKDLLIKYYGKDLSFPLAVDKAIEAAAGFYIIPGSWFCSVIQQDDGLIVLEAPISSRFSDQIIVFANQKFSAEKIKTVVSTSPAWPHIGGLRSFIAEDIPVIHSNLNTSLLQKLASADFSSEPDKQEKLQKNLISVPVSEKTEIGKGKNRMIIYPLNAEASEGMMIVYFPEHKLLYTSDLVQNLTFGDQPLFREYATEILKAIKREKLEVQKIYGMHLPPVTLEDFEKAFDYESKDKAEI